MKLVSGFHHTRGNHCGSTAMRDLLHCAALDLNRARRFPVTASSSPDTTTRAVAPLADNAFESLPEIAFGALRENARAILSASDPHAGIAGMKTLADDLANWGDAPDWQFCARFGYQIVERRGTGGGAFCKMYADYLRETEAIAPDLRAAKLPNSMVKIADAWTAFALLLKRVSDEKNRALFAEARDALRDLAAREENFWRMIE